MLPPFIAELSLTLWLLLKGVDVQKWEARAAALVHEATTNRPFGARVEKHDMTLRRARCRVNQLPGRQRHVEEVAQVLVL